MFRNDKRRIRFGIRGQMFFGMLTVFLASSIALYLLVDHQISTNREAQIVGDLQQIRENTELYVRQILIMNEANNDQESFIDLAENILQELSEAGWPDAGIYTGEGIYLAGAQISPKEKQPEDFMQALEGKAAYTLSYPDEAHMEVYFSMPVVVDKNLGIMRYCLDYQELFEQGQQMEMVVLRVISFVFLAAMLIIFLLLAHIIHPIRSLGGISRQVAMELARGNVNLQRMEEMKAIRRRDEIGDLTRDYGSMLETAGKYIQKIQDDRAQIAQILNSRQQFYNNVTHELKTPLTTIQGYGQLIQDDHGRDPELLEKGIGHILHESARLHEMVLQLLDMADRTEPEERIPVELHRMIAEVAEAMEPKAKRYSFSLSLQMEESLYVTGHRDQLRQVFVNLLDNAIKYGKPGTVIGIAAERSKDFVICAVRNQGQTLTQKQLENIFEPFYRVDKEYSRMHGSAGLGLAICRKIMTEHGGKIYAKSLQGQVIFYLIFPNGEQKEGDRI